MTLLVEFPIVLYFEEAQARLRDKPIDIPTLHSTALLLVTQGANMVLVPAFEHKDQIKQTADSLPPSLRHRIKLVDERATLLRKVRRFVEPLLGQISEMDEMSTESIFVRQVIPFLYQLTVAAKYNAGTTDGWIHDITHHLHNIKFDVFKGEARARLAILAHLVTSYRPFVTAHANVRGYESDPGMREKLFAILESTEFYDVVEKSGYLGLVRRPRVALERLRRSVVSLVSKPSVRAVARAADTVSTLAAQPILAEPLLDLAGRAQARGGFSPPMLDLSSFRREIYYASLAEHNTACRPPPGALFQIHVHQPGICGNIWADSHAKLPKYDVKKHHEWHMNCHLTAKNAVTRLLGTGRG